MATDTNTITERQTMNLNLPLLASAAAALAVLNPATAQDDAKKRSADRPIFVSTDSLMGCKVEWPGDAKCTVKDALVDPSTGRIAGLVMDSGAIASFDRLCWNPDASCFSCTKPHAGTAEAASSKKKTDAEAKDAAASTKAGRPLDGTFLLSSVVSLPLVGYERTEEGDRKDCKIGSVGGAFVDTCSGNLAFVTTSVGGVLGIGAESRVIPWSAVCVERGAEGEFQLGTDIHAKRLEKAPAFGDGADNLHNPNYRDTLYSYYGTRRADFEPASSDGVSVIPVDQMMGATIVRAGDAKGSLKDLVLDPKSGQVSLAICANGDVVPASALRWDERAKQFQLSGDVKPVEMDANQEQILASALADYSVMCGTERTGDLEDVYFDANAGKIAYLSIEKDGVRVLPWSVVTLNTEGKQPSICLGCAHDALENAPKLNGEMGATIYSPAFRARVAAVETKPQ